MVKLLDCTTRDSGHLANWNYTEEYIFSLIKKLNKQGVNFYEIGYRNYFEKKGKGAFYYCTCGFIEKFYKVKGSLKLGVMVDEKRYNNADFTGADYDYLDFIRIAVHPDKIKEALLIAENLHNKKYKVMLQIMDVSNLSKTGYEALLEWKNKDIIETLYFADTYGILTPLDISFYFEKFKTAEFKHISFHAHNKNGHALSNTKLAIKLGAYSVDIVQGKSGINGGNLNFYDLKSAL